MNFLFCGERTHLHMYRQIKSHFCGERCCCELLKWFEWYAQEPFFLFRSNFRLKNAPYYVGFQNERHKMAQIPCDISVYPWGGTEICDSREA